MSYLYNVSQLKAALQTNGAKSDKFTIRFGAPAGDNSLNLGADGQILCKGASFPQKTISSMEAWVQGRRLHLPGNTSYAEDWELEFYNTTDHSLRQMFLSWMDALDNYEKNTHVCNPSMFMVDADVMQLDCNGDASAGYTFHNLFPSQVGAIELSGEASNNIEIFKVQFSFSHWTVLAV